MIEGGKPLSGRVSVGGNKNGALPIIAACLLTDQECIVENVPRIRDTEVMAELVKSVGAEVEWIEQNTLRIKAAGEIVPEINRALSVQIRASILLAGPLLARCGSVLVPPPGGDVIGRRRIDTHLHAFAALGAEIEVERDFMLRAPNGLIGDRFFMDEPSVTATENAVMAAVLAKGDTTLINAACEPHVQDLCRFLVSMGAEIDGIGSNVLCVHGRASLGGARHRIGPDHIEVASFIGLAAVTRGEIVIDDVEPEDLHPVLHGFERLGVRIELDGRQIHGQKVGVESTHDTRLCGAHRGAHCGVWWPWTDRQARRRGRAARPSTQLYAATPLGRAVRAERGHTPSLLFGVDCLGLA